MLADALIFLKNQVNAYMKSGWSPTDTHPDPVDFIDGDKLDPLTFNPGAISILLLNLEEDNSTRSADPFLRVNSDGSHQRVQPDLRLNLYALFVARYSVYQQALENLSQVIQFFQSNRVFKHPSAVGLSNKIEQLTVELVTLPFAGQNEVWNALRASYHPSVLYRVKVLVFQDPKPTGLDKVTEKIISIKEISEDHQVNG